MRARHRLSKLLLRRVYEGSAWTLAHDAWLRRQRFPSRPLSLAFDECYGAVAQAKGRRDSLDCAITELASEAPFSTVVSRLVCLRGVSTLTALALSVELGDWERFRPRSLGPFLGLVPSEDSTGGRRRQGAITKTGNTHARRLNLVRAVAARATRFGVDLHPTSRWSRPRPPVFAEDQRFNEQGGWRSRGVGAELSPKDRGLRLDRDVDIPGSAYPTALTWCEVTRSRARPGVGS